MSLAHEGTPASVSDGIGVESLSFAYPGGGHRLADVTFSVSRGEMCCLLGPNGAGKTTLLRCLLGFLTPGAGSIKVLGNDIARLSVRQLARLVAYVPQASTTPFPYTALQMVVMGRTPHVGATASPSRADRLSALEQLERLGIAHLARRPFPQLSGGERQLTLLARALVQEAPVLVLDEPTSALDYGNEVRFLELVAQLVHGGRAVLMTTHQPVHALTHAHRAVLMRDGTVVADGPTAAVVTSDTLSDLYGVRIHVAQVTIPPPLSHVQSTCLPVRSPAPEHHQDEEKNA